MFHPRQTFRDARDTAYEGGRSVWDRVPEVPLPARFRHHRRPTVERSDLAVALLGLGAAAVVAGTWYVVASEPRRRRVRRAALKALDGIGVHGSRDQDHVVKRGPSSLT
ncbi:hypothetical protein [Amorphus sp. 3PC139-8]|uniref:hypothetical protein n=1 Tax=Amorphus sp. 3PC139-8 TaxID=2735676 RepID=UPI00345D64F0